MNYPNDFIGKVIQGNCLEILPEIPNHLIDLVLTSPPYNTKNSNLGYQPGSTVGQNYYNTEFTDNMTESEYKEFIFEVVELCLKKSRYVFWNMQLLVSTKNIIIELLYNFRNNLKDIFIWKKQAIAQISAKENPRLAPGFEFVFMFGQDNSKIFKYSNFPENAYLPNIKEWYKTESFPEHHATFTKEMCKYFIEYFTKPNDIILDPFCGSGTTCVSALELGRRFIGIDISKEYCELSISRIIKEQSQGKLFF